IQKPGKFVSSSGTFICAPKCNPSPLYSKRVMFEMSHFPGPYRSDFSLRPFRIAIPQSELDDLQNRLARTRWPAELPGAGRNYGVPPDRLKQLVEYWHTCYDWRKYEALLNSFPQFTTAIDGAKIHFLHVRSPEKKALPLVITHGRSEEHTSELQSRENLVCRLLLEKNKLRYST